ncbi:glycerol-3-phosphate responsive antiterminator [Anoxynatronum buryatiense]|nr:glycerol-3-phosphate responsive antiterminator [Anoxynatronum buryatiense]
MMTHQQEVIATIHDHQGLVQALGYSQVKTLFVMNGDLMSLADTIATIHKAQRRVFLHVDFIQGLATDAKGLEYVAQRLKPNGIITTRSQVVQLAKKHGLITVQRLFLIDTGGLQAGIKNLRHSQPDAVEVMPGVIPRVIRELRQSLTLPLIVGGLIHQREEIQMAFDAGADAVSLSGFQCWYQQ